MTFKNLINIDKNLTFQTCLTFIILILCCYKEWNGFPDEESLKMQFQFESFGCYLIFPSKLIYFHQKFS